MPDVTSRMRAGRTSGSHVPCRIRPSGAGPVRVVVKITHHLGIELDMSIRKSGNCKPDGTVRAEEGGAEGKGLVSVPPAGRRTKEESAAFFKFNSALAGSESLRGLKPYLVAKDCSWAGVRTGSGNDGSRTRGIGGPTRLRQNRASRLHDPTMIWLWKRRAEKEGACWTVHPGLLGGQDTVFAFS
jgi:hypothetical protein